MQQRHSLLVVDDEPNVVQSLHDLFRLDYDVRTATSAEQALDIMRANEIHMVMTDQRMPFMTGVELLAELKGDYPDAIRLLFTGYAEIDAVIDAINQGNVFRYIAKPWNADELQETMKDAAKEYERIIERQHLIEKLEEANRLKESFIDLIGHELTTPAFALSAAELAGEMQAKRYPALAPCLRAIRSASQRLQEIVTTMLRLSAQGNFSLGPTLEDLPLGDLLEELRTEINPCLEARSITLSVRADPAMILRADRAMIEDVLVSLVGNAIRFCPNGGTVAIGASRENDTLRIDVTDAGIGIDREDLPHIFEPFFTTAAAPQEGAESCEFGSHGAGLGLAVVKKFVELHQGTVEVESTRGQGTRVTVRLPALQQQELREAEARDQVGRPLS